MNLPGWAEFSMPLQVEVEVEVEVGFQSAVALFVFSCVSRDVVYLIDT